MCLCH